MSIGGRGRPRSCNCGECVKCKRADYMREWYRKKTPTERRELVLRRSVEKVRAADTRRSKTPERLSQNAANTRRWRENHPDRYAAHIAVGNAVRSGALVKKPCEKCGSTQVHAHHDDYSKPLEVRWLCPEHHAEEKRD